jgi:hypothetical protein
MEEIFLVLLPGRLVPTRSEIMGEKMSDPLAPEKGNYKIQGGTEGREETEGSKGGP